MRVVHINTADNEGGAARAAFRLHSGLLEAGHESTMLVGRRAERRPEIADVRPAPLAARAARRAIGEVERLTGLQYLLGWWGPQIASHPLVRNADVIHLHNLHGGYFPLRISFQRDGIREEQKPRAFFQRIFVFLARARHVRQIPTIGADRIRRAAPNRRSQAIHC